MPEANLLSGNNAEGATDTHTGATVGWTLKALVSFAATCILTGAVLAVG